MLVGLIPSLHPCIPLAHIEQLYARDSVSDEHTKNKQTKDIGSLPSNALILRGNTDVLYTKPCDQSNQSQMKREL